MKMSCPVSDRRRTTGTHAAALVLWCCPMAMAAEEKPAGPADTPIVGELYRVQEVSMTLTMTKDPSVVRREIFEQISENCRPPNPTGSGITLWTKDQDRTKLSDRELSVITTFPEEGVKVESFVPITGQVSGTAWLVQRSQGAHFLQTSFSISPEPWSPGTQIMSNNLSRSKRLGPCPPGWRVGENRWLVQRKLKSMPPPEFPDGPIDKLKR
jgi:hypothetical protein